MSSTPRLAVVVGAGSGIGAAFATALAATGDVVVCADVDLARAGDVVDEIAATGGRATAVGVDVCSDFEVAALYETAAELGPVDLLVHCPGVAVVGPAAGIGLEHWQHVFDVNLFGAVRAVNAVVPAMLERGTGHVLFVGSIASLMPVGPRAAVYSASKAALLSYAETLRSFVEGQGVRVSVLCPGPVRTNIAERTISVGPPNDDPVSVHGEVPVLDPAKVVEVALEQLQAGRFYLHTHAEFVPALRARHAAIEDSLAGLLASSKISAEAPPSGTPHRRGSGPREPA